jgi:chorismate synthase
MLRWLSGGESHGQGMVAILEGFPAGVKLESNFINLELAARQLGPGRGERMKIEHDKVKFLSGVRGGYTLGTPITLLIENKDWVNWQKIMAPEGVIEGEALTNPRPGHSDLAGALKYGHQDIRNVFERASARETVTRVAVGALAKQLLFEFGVSIWNRVVEIGGVKLPKKEREINLVRGTTLLKVLRVKEIITNKMEQKIKEAEAEGDTLGGKFEVICFGLPPGLGSYSQWDRKLDGGLAQAIMSIQGIKAVEIGMGVESSLKKGSEFQDEIFYSYSVGFYRKSNRAGGIEGGVSNGEPLVIKATMKPIPTLRKPLGTVDILTKKPTKAARERGDTCAVYAASVIGGAAVAFELAKAFCEKFGGDSLKEMKSNYRSYLRKIKEYWRPVSSLS